MFSLMAAHRVGSSGRVLATDISSKLLSYAAAAAQEAGLNNLETQVMDAEGAGAVAVCQDAHMDEVYLGLYAAGSGGVPELLGAERLHGQSVMSELELEPGRFTAAGFGWQRYPQLPESNRDRFAAQSEVLYPRAADLLPLGAELVRTGKTVLPQDVVPAYLRQKVAEKPSNAP